MRKYLLTQLRKEVVVVNNWARTHLTGIFIFNLTVLLMVLLNAAEYFKPFIYLSINLIVFLSLIFSILFLGAKEKSLFVIAIIFFLFSAFLKTVKIDVWADRASIYAFQSFVLAVLLLFIGNFAIYNDPLKKK